MTAQTVLDGELAALAVALLGIVVGGVAARSLGVPLLLGYLLAGVGAQVVVRPTPSLHLLGTLGMVLLMFFLGMGFDWRLLLTGRRLGTIALNFLVNFGLPCVGLWALGCPLSGAFFVAMAVYPTSSAVTFTAFAQLRRLAYPEAETCLWLSLGEDLTILILLGVAGAVVGSGTRWTTAALGFGFIVVMLVASVVLTRPLERLFARLPSELDNLVTLASVVALSTAAQAFGASEMLGAFLAGMLFSGTRDRSELEQRLLPLRELGTAVFFFTFGLQMSLRLTPTTIGVSGALLVAGIAGKVIIGWIAGRVDALRTRAHRRLMMSLWARGELSALALLLSGETLPPFWRDAVSWFIVVSIVVGVVAIRYAERAAR